MASHVVARGDDPNKMGDRLSFDLADGSTWNPEIPGPDSQARVPTQPRAGKEQARSALRMVAEREGGGGRIVEGPFTGQFGTWIVDEKDAAEVLVYRSSLVVAALAVAAASGMVLVPAVLGGDAPAAWYRPASLRVRRVGCCWGSARSATRSCRRGRRGLGIFHPTHAFWSIG